MKKENKSQPIGARRKFEFERTPKVKPIRTGPKRDTLALVQKRAAKVTAALSRWQTRLAIANRKVNKLLQQQRYYATELARRAAESNPRNEAVAGPLLNP